MNRASSAATSSSQFSDDAGIAYAELVAVELADQRATKASLEQRAMALVSASGVFVTALFGFIAFLKDKKTFQMPTDARVALYVALGLFVVAALGALFVNKPSDYLAIDPTATDKLGLDRVIRERWGNPPAIARRRTAVTRLGLYADYRRANAKKAQLLIRAVIAEALAVLALAVSVALMLHAA